MVIPSSWLDLKTIRGPWCHDFAGIVRPPIVSTSTHLLKHNPLPTPHYHPIPRQQERVTPGTHWGRLTDGEAGACLTSLPPPMTLRVQRCLLAEPMEAPGYPNLSLLFSFFFYMPNDSVISQLDKLVRGSSEKAWHMKVGVIAWVCREKGLGVVRGTGTLVWGVLGWGGWGVPGSLAMSSTPIRHFSRSGPGRRERDLQELEWNGN